MLVEILVVHTIVYCIGIAYAMPEFQYLQAQYCINVRYVYRFGYVRDQYQIFHFHADRQKYSTDRDTCDYW